MMDIYSVSLQSFKSDIAKGYVFKDMTVPIAVSIKEIEFESPGYGTVKMYAYVDNSERRVYDAEAVFGFQYEGDNIYEYSDGFETVLYRKLVESFISMNLCILETAKFCNDAAFTDESQMPTQYN